MLIPKASFMVTNSWLLSGWQQRDKVTHSEWVTSLSGSLRATTSRAQSHRPLERQRHLRRNEPDRVG